MPSSFGSLRILPCNEDRAVRPLKAKPETALRKAAGQPLLLSFLDKKAEHVVVCAVERGTCGCLRAWWLQGEGRFIVKWLSTP